MANNYSDATGVLMFDGTAIITPVIRMLFEPFKLDDNAENDLRSEYYVAVLSEDNHYDWDGYLEEIAEKAMAAFGIDFTEHLQAADIVKALGVHFGADLSALAESIYFDEFVVLRDVVSLALSLKDGHNLIGFCLEGCWHCDRPRLWEFGGWASYGGSRYAIDHSTSGNLMLARNLDECLADGAEQAASLLGKHIDDLIDGITDESIRAQVAHRLGASLSRRDRTQICATTDAPPIAPPTNWVREVYVEAHATDEGAGPGYARLKVTPAFIRSLQSLRALCIERELTEVRITDAPDAWGPGTSSEDLRLSAPELVVTPRMFWFTDHPKGMPFEIETRGQQLDRFIAEASGVGEPLYLGIEPGDVEDDDPSSD